MIWVALILLVVGFGLSGFFSGSETGFYRASRVRLVMDGMEGDRFSKQLLRLTNNPQLFVATTLVGNNVANYLVSLAIVMLAREIFVSQSNLAELLAPIVLAPVLFVYGESLPKNLFYHAPNRLLRWAAPLFIFFSMLFAPLSALLWGLGRLLERILGEAPEKIQSSLARKELHQVIAEGHDVGLLHGSQRYLAQNFFIHASKPVAEKCRAIGRFPFLTEQASVQHALRIARRNRLSDIPVRHSESKKIIGYVQSAELLVNRQQDNGIQPFIQELPEIHADELHGEALLKMQGERQSLAQVVNQNGETIGLLTLMSLSEPLLSGPLSTLRR